MHKVNGITQSQRNRSRKRRDIPDRVSADTVVESTKRVKRPHRPRKPR